MHRAIREEEKHRGKLALVRIGAIGAFAGVGGAIAAVASALVALPAINLDR